MLRTCISILATYHAFTFVRAQDERTLGPWAQHLTEPDHRTPLITVHLKPEDTSLLDDSYIFITPYISDYRMGSFGPQIFTTDGTLIWNGNHTAKVRAMDAHVCDYMGELGDHICYNDARPVEQGGHSTGAIRFFDKTYTQVGPDYGAEADLRAPDIHELNTPRGQRGETFIQDIYEVKKMDLRPYKGPENGYVLDGCFQEVALRTKEVIFEWCALDWMPIWDTYMYLHAVNSENYSLPIAGNGAMIAPWDFFHINAIARDLEGDYAVSGRHLNTIFKIAGKDNPHGVDPGSILWRLGGKHNDFQMDFNFSRQHTVRFHSTGSEESLLSLFDNAFDGWLTSSKWSSGKMIRINNATKEASLITQYDDPERQLSFSQGSLQLLENGNVFIGWGNRHFFSEYTYEGDLLYHASFSGDIETFRAWKFPWKGYPTWRPKILSYAQSCNSPQYAYASWNGATEVRNWRFYSSWGTQYGPWHEVGTFTKSGFETAVNITEAAPLPSYGKYAPYMYVEALGASGEVLNSSDVVHTFVPRNETVARKFGCNETMCGEEYFRFEETWSCGASCPRQHTASIYVMTVLICVIELVSWAYGMVLWQKWQSTVFTRPAYDDLDSDIDIDDLVFEKYDLDHQQGSYADGYQGNIGRHHPGAPAMEGGRSGMPNNGMRSRQGSLGHNGSDETDRASFAGPSQTKKSTCHDRRRSQNNSITKLDDLVVPKRGSSILGRMSPAMRVKASGTDSTWASPV